MGLGAVGGFGVYLFAEPGFEAWGTIPLQGEGSI